jgi:hypothetical protein
MRAITKIPKAERDDVMRLVMAASAGRDGSAVNIWQLTNTIAEIPRAEREGVMRLVTAVSAGRPWDTTAMEDLTRAMRLIPIVKGEAVVQRLTGASPGLGKDYNSLHLRALIGAQLGEAEKQPVAAAPARPTPISPGLKKVQRVKPMVPVIQRRQKTK